MYNGEKGGTTRARQPRRRHRKLTRGRRKREESRESPMAVSAQAASRYVKERESRAELRPTRAKAKRHAGGETAGAAHEKREGRGARMRGDRPTGCQRRGGAPKDGGRGISPRASRRAMNSPAKGVRHGDAGEDMRGDGGRKDATRVHSHPRPVFCAAR